MVLADPPEPDEPKRRQMNVRLPVPLIEQIDERRKVRGLSRDEFVRRAMTYALTSGPRAPTPGQRRSGTRQR